jgi:cyclopropane-fatty-acyl-phospholipid synthase
MPRAVALQLAGLVERLIGAPLAIRLRAWDGTEAGPADDPDAPVAVVRHRRALR